MRKLKTIIAVAAAVTVLATLAPAAADPLAQRDIPELLQQAPKRYLASEAGKEEQLSFLFGPYIIPPGQDSNRITADIQLPAGFVRAVSPELVDATTGAVPTEQEAHIHHAHWFRVTDDPNEIYYTDVGGAGALPDFVPQEVVDALPENAGLSWVFGTGEEKTQGGFAPREALDDVDGNGIPDVLYGMEIDQAERQLLIYMIHNKTAAPLEVFVALDVDFMHGTAEEITNVKGIPMRPLKGQLFGQTRDATRSYPSLIGRNGSQGWTVDRDGTIIVAGGHAHPGAYGVFVTNQGPGGACQADVDGDGFPGVTILKSRKIDAVPGAWPYSEDFQMGVAKYGWRAPVHEGDVLTQYGVYDIDNEVTNPAPLMPGTDKVSEWTLPGEIADGLGYPQAEDLDGMSTRDGLPHQYFEAMNHVGVYIDPEQDPLPYSAETDANGCPLNFADASSAHLLGDDTPRVQQTLRDTVIGKPYFAEGITEGMQNHVWPAFDPTCGDFNSPNSASRPVCENSPISYNTNGTGMETDTIHIAGFAYLPGNHGFPDGLGTPPRVTQGTVLRVINEDAALNVRHTLTTCAWPCTGTYVANYPVPDGALDTDKLGNIDPIDGGLSGPESLPVIDLDTSHMDPGFYSYYCRIHPFMRGALEIVA